MNWKFGIVRLLFVPLLLFPLHAARAELEIEITPLTLVEGLYSLEVMANVQIDSALGIIEEYIEEALDKPEVMRGFVNGNAATAPFLIQGRRYQGFSVWVGANAALAAGVFDVAGIQETLNEFQPEDDFYMGVGLHPLTFCLAVPLDVLLRGLSISAGFGLFKVEYEQIEFESLSVQTALSYSVLQPFAFHRFLAWQGLTLHAGFSYGRNDLSTSLQIDPILQSFNFDPDGPGPLFPILLEVQLAPEIEVGMMTRLFGWPLVASTGFRLLETLTIHGGGGGTFTTGTNGIEVRMDEQIEVLGYLGDLIDEPSSVIISGLYDGPRPKVFHPFVYGGLLLEISLFYLNVSVQYSFDSVLSAGASVGISF
jgi:hypothetical protein